MKNWLVVAFAALTLIPLTSQAQRWKRYRYEVSFGLSAANFLGELGGADQVGTDYFKDLELVATRPGLMAGMRYKITPLTAAKVEFNWGIVAGDDALTTEVYRNQRSLHFRSHIFELNARYEFLMLKERTGHIYSLRGIRGRKRLELYPYGFIGVGGFYFNPQAKAPSGKWTSLQPLGTEGQQGVAPTRKPYSRFQFAIPVGLGFKYAIDRTWLIGLEYGIRKTFTDYIDDASTTYVDNNAIAFTNGPVAAALADPTGGAWEGANPGQQRGDPTDNDSYMFMTISVNYKLRTGRNNLPKFFRR